MFQGPEFSSTNDISGYLTDFSHGLNADFQAPPYQRRKEESRRSRNVPYSSQRQNKSKKSIHVERRTSKEDNDSNKDVPESSIQNVLHLPTMDSADTMPLELNKIINGLGSKSRSFTGPLAETQFDFPYWNLLRQKWLLSAQPRRLSQVRLFKKKRTPKKMQGKYVVQTRKDSQNSFRDSLSNSNKRSFLYFFKLLNPDESKNENEYSPNLLSENLAYPKCYLNNVSCW